MTLSLTSYNISLSDGTKLRQGSMRATSTFLSTRCTSILNSRFPDVMTGSPCHTTSRAHPMSPSPVRTFFLLVSAFFLQHHTVGHPHREQWHEIGRKFKQRFHLSDYDEEPDEYPRHPAGSCRVQAVRSVSDWSHGVLTEHSTQNACE